MLWDDHQSRCIGELSFRVEVRAVKLRRDKIVVVLEHKIYVYNFSDLKIVHQTDTVANPKGLCALSPPAPALVQAAPGPGPGCPPLAACPRPARCLPSAYPGCPLPALAGHALAAAPPLKAALPPPPAVPVIVTVSPSTDT